MKIKVEHSWLNEHEALYYDEDKGVYHYEMTSATGNHRFYISTKLDPRPISRELIDEYASVLGLSDDIGVVTPEPAVVVSEPTIEYNPELDAIIVNDGCGNCVTHQLPSNPGDYHTLDIKDFPKTEEYSLDTSLGKWAGILFSPTTAHTSRTEYLKVAGYDKVVIIGDMMAVYTGDQFELVKIPEYDWHWQLIMSPELIEVLKTHKQKAG